MDLFNIAIISSLLQGRSRFCLLNRIIKFEVSFFDFFYLVLVLTLGEHIGRVFVFSSHQNYKP
uniref:Uncharacterized protein n=1 Tax=Lepeophtheirus salmonis TaxID=72036 RepID=A0A0K2UT06_LEPSM